ncbi:MAG: penicillin-binding protein 2 [Blastocatellia bacterium]
MTPVKQANFNPSEDLRDSGLRLQVIYYIALGIFVILIGRLWYLQVMKGETYAERADANRTRILKIAAERGKILDRKGKVLVTSKTSYNIVLSRKDVADFAEITELLVNHLEIEREWLAKRFEAARFEPKYESIVVKELATTRDAAWVEAHQMEYPMIRVEKAPQRVYVYGELAAHALGYVGEVSPKELKDPNGQFSKERGFKLGDIIGKFGIERTYNEILMGKDGERRVLVDSRGRIQKEIETIPPIPGRNLYTTLDREIQLVAEEQGSTMPEGRGAVAVMDPNNGEVLAMVSRPAFDPNIFSQSAKTPEGKEEIVRLQEDEDKPLYNRVIQGAFPPGSTWKLLTAVAGLNEGVITPADSKLQDGGIQFGNYYMSSMSHDYYPDVVRSILHSNDGYFYRLGLKMGVEKFEKWVDKFGFGQRTGIDLPNERPGIPPKRTTKFKEYDWQIRKVEKQLAEATDKTLRAQLEFRIKQLKHESEWTQYDMAASAFGQGRNATTPIQLLRYVSGLANGGYMHTPHLLLRADAGADRFGNSQPEARFVDKDRFQVPMSAEIYEIVKKGMWGAVNDGGGTARGTMIEGFDVSGKTGTAQVASKTRAGAKNKDHAWMIAFAPRDKPEICSVVLTENAGFGGTHSAPRTKVIYEDYYKRTRGITDEVAEGTKAEEKEKKR